ncbi:MAG TPA: hypothetical protein GX520_00305 [Syntrophaceticus sp.]|nr:hypothetical protein [Syntrophaceticus schinkii]MDD2359251.1 hypothetical protein [Syntrophaceticus schinkii]MDD4261394.1 hypothetical protein [Syntrophaceticus schinkii]MDD4675040.1 hypothetical protein [Syntrophaceticus schinkii]HHY29127.1 hypothetical protein [Syntrophaceticus sp.]
MISTLPAPAATVGDPAVLEVTACQFLIVLLVSKELIRTIIHTPGKKLLSGILRGVYRTMYLVMVPQFFVFAIIVLTKIYQVVPSK